jgi:hypothetical protein
MTHFRRKHETIALNKDDVNRSENLCNLPFLLSFSVARKPEFNKNFIFFFCWAR